MKPFDLEKALAGDPVVTRDGRNIVEIVYFKKREKWPLIALFEEENTIRAYDYNGIYCRSAEDSNGYDLFMAPKTKKLWIAIQKQVSHPSIRVHHTSRACPDLEMIKRSYSEKDHYFVEMEVEE